MHKTRNIAQNRRSEASGELFWSLLLKVVNVLQKQCFDGCWGDALQRCLKGTNLKTKFNTLKLSREVAFFYSTLFRITAKNIQVTIL